MFTSKLFPLLIGLHVASYSLLSIVRGSPGRNAMAIQTYTIKERQELPPPMEVSHQGETSSSTHNPFEGLPLDILIDRRPHSTTNQEGKLYAKTFAQHPEILKINFRNQNEVKLAQEVMDLRQGKVDRIWNNRMTASIRQYFKDKKMDMKLFERIKQFYWRERRLRTGKAFRERWKREDPEGYKEWRNQNSRDYRAGLKNKSKKVEQSGSSDLERGTQLMNRPLNYHLKSSVDANNEEEEQVKMSIDEIVEKVSALRPLYSSDGHLGHAIRKYLNENNYSKGEIAMVMGGRGIRRNRESQRTNKVRMDGPAPSPSRQKRKTVNEILNAKDWWNIHNF